MKFKEFFEKNANFLGTCVNSFDDDGECTVPGLYNDTTDFANAEESASEITKAEFETAVGTIQYQLDKEISKERTYFHDENNDIYYLYDDKSDIHYFFKK